MDRLTKTKQRDELFSDSRWSGKGTLEGSTVSTDTIPESERIETYASPEVQALVDDNE